MEGNIPLAYEEGLVLLVTPRWRTLTLYIYIVCKIYQTFFDRVSLIYPPGVAPEQDMTGKTAKQLK